MAQTNSKRVDHDIGTKPNTFRDGELRQIINDLDEFLHDKGYEEVIRDGNNFVTKITIWDSSSKNYKRFECNYTRTTPPFLDELTLDVYDEKGAGTIVATVTKTAVRDSNKRILSVDTSIVRP